MEHGEACHAHLRGRSQPQAARDCCARAYQSPLGIGTLPHDLASRARVNRKTLTPCAHWFFRPTQTWEEILSGCRVGRPGEHLLGLSRSGG